MDNITQDTMDLVKGALGSPNDDLAKSISTATGLVAYDLQAPAKNLYPVQTPVRNAIPRVGGGTGTATNWRVVSAITGSGYDSMGWVPEGQRSGNMSYTTANKAASYATIGEEDNITMEAINAARGFEDLQATMTMRLLQKMMLKEELALLGGNQSMNLGTPATPTLSSSGSGATLPTATYSVIVVALTFEGYQTATLAAGIPTTKTITGADGANFVLNGGSSIPSAAQTQAVTLGGHLFASTTAIQGAVAYAWFVGLAGAERLEQITTINSMVVSTALTGGARQTAASLPGTDCSKNANYAFDGLFVNAATAANGAYYRMLATGTAGTGTVLTASGRGSVVEIDTMLKSMYDSYQLSPTVLLVSSQELQNITSKVLSNSSGPLLRYEPGQGGYDITANGTISSYFNPYATWSGGTKIPVRLHPKVPAGTILGWCENLPMQYQSNEVPNVAEVKTRQDYYQIDWPIITRKRAVGVYAEEVLAVYAPFAMGVISNIANG